MPAPKDSHLDHSHTPPRLLADHPALDLINTVELAEGAPIDYWQSDADVMTWLTRVNLLPSQARTRPPKGLLETARELRELARVLILRKKSGKKLDLTALNRALQAGRSHLALQADADGSLAITKVYTCETPPQYLVPLAESTADLLVNGDFDLVRKCESDDCVLWFYDRTRSHRRRWCSMSLCGNRHKVAAFRKREAETEEDS